jgi:predicted Zn finger-like uncharacterized protein
MSIITSCPHCKTTFSVANEILNKYKGFVRCASCSGVFNASEHEIKPEDKAEVKTQINKAESINVPSTISENNSDEASKVNKAKKIDDADTTDTITNNINAKKSDNNKNSAKITEKNNDKNNAEKDTNTNVSTDASLNKPISNSLMQNSMLESSSFIDRLRYLFTSKSLNNTAVNADSGTLNISKIGGKILPNATELNKRLNKWGNTQKKRPLFMMASIFLATALFLQILYWQKDNIANFMPSSAPILKLYAKIFGGHLAPLKLSNNPVVSFSDMQKDLSANANRYILNVGLQNRYSGEVAMPNLEVSLFDLNEQIITRRVFHPQLFLTTADWKRLEKYGLRENEELPVKLRFETNQVVSSFKVVVFYP